MLSKTYTASLGQNNFSIGSGAMNSIRVLSVGSVPGIIGSVRILFKFAPSAGGTILFRLKFKKAFLIGKRPGDYRPLKPKMFIET